MLLCGLGVLFLFSPVLYAQEGGEAEIPKPVIRSIIKSPNEKNAVDIIGKSQPDLGISVEVLSNQGDLALKEEAVVTSDGTWSLTIPDASIPTGTYVLRVTAHDANGATSKSVEARGSKVRPKPLIAIGGLEFGWFSIFILFFFFVVIAAGIFAWRYERERRKRDVYIMMAERDITSMCTLLSNEVDRLSLLLKEAKGIEPHIASEADYLIKNEQTVLQKMQGYLSAGVQKIR